MCTTSAPAGGDSFNHVYSPMNSPAANRVAPGAAVAHSEGVPSAGASYTPGYRQRPPAGPLTHKPPTQCAVCRAREGGSTRPPAGYPRYIRRKATPGSTATPLSHAGQVSDLADG